MKWLICNVLRFNQEKILTIEKRFLMKYGHKKSCQLFLLFIEICCFLIYLVKRSLVYKNYHFSKVRGSGPKHCLLCWGEN
jgi:hypothetical protein